MSTRRCAVLLVTTALLAGPVLASGYRLDPAATAAFLDDQRARGYDLADHLDVLARHAPDLRVHTVLVDPGAVRDRDRLERVAGALGAQVSTHDVASDTPGVHDARKLGSAYAAVFGAN